jgi:hypothetical protein
MAKYALGESDTHDSDPPWSARTTQTLDSRPNVRCRTEGEAESRYIYAVTTGAKRTTLIRVAR